MAETEETTQGSSNGSETRKAALRAAAIAAASGATAIAAKRAFSDRQESGTSRRSDNGNDSGSAAAGDSMVSGMLSSGWTAARDALVPFAKDAAKAGGEYLAQNGPEIVRDTIVPAFIDGFQGAGRNKKSKSKSDEDEDE